MAKNIGKFITLEGSEGVGKSTQMETIRHELESAGIEVLLTREPGGTPKAEAIRQLLLKRDSEQMPESCELLLMFAARATHLHNFILPALNRGVWVVCDRFTDATYAYQGYGRGLSLDFISQLEQWVQQDVRPDMTILLDAPVEQAMLRAKARNKSQGLVEVDRFEIEQSVFFERVRHGYLARASAEPDRFQVINAGDSLEAVTQATRMTIRSFLNKVL